MPLITRHGFVIGVLLLLLVASGALNIVFLYRQANRPLFAEGDGPLIERTIAHFAAQGPNSEEEIRANSFPIVLRLGDRRCVELRYGRQGHQGACYDLSEQLIEETEGVTH
jgi:hypothetical protein